MTGSVEAFIARWQGREGGQERANYGLFLTELCTVLDLPQPDPADATSDGNDYVFERGVRESARRGGNALPHGPDRLPRRRQALRIAARGVNASRSYRRRAAPGDQPLVQTVNW